jgi:UPF0176 protein
MTIVVSAFYKFTAIATPADLKIEIAALSCRLGLRGSILLAEEGINATVSGSKDAVTAFLCWLRSNDRIGEFDSKESTALSHPFRRLKVKVKPEIITFGHPDVRPNESAGTYVRPENWNAIIQEAGVVTIDTRNSYETNIGTFKGAVDPKTETFSAFADYVDHSLSAARDQKIAMFCTGGIRCEKATAYLRAKGFTEVYHLQGGILKYLEVVPQTESLWQGDLFIFDDRIALDHGRKSSARGLCRACGKSTDSGLPCRNCSR